MRLKIFSVLVLMAWGADAVLVTGSKGKALVDAQGNALASLGDFMAQLNGLGEKPNRWTNEQVRAFFHMNSAERIFYLRTHPGLGGVTYENLPAEAGASLPARQLPAPATVQEEDDDLARAIEESLRMSSHGPSAAATTHNLGRTTNPEPHLGAIRAWEHRPFAKREKGFGDMIDIGYDGPGRTAQYEPYNFPKAPMLHTYNPYKGAVDGEEHMWQGDHHVPYVSVNLKAPTDLFRDRLPPAIKDSVSGISSDKLDIFWIVQDNPWTNSARVLFRPHYWVDPDAPFQGAHNAQIPFHARILSSIPEGIEFNANLRAIIHSVKGIVVSSPNEGLVPKAARLGETFSFWSLTSAPVKVKGRADEKRTAITLHWFLNDQDNWLMLEAIHRSRSLADLLNALHKGMDPSPILHSRLLPELDRFLDFHPPR